MNRIMEKFISKKEGRKKRQLRIRSKIRGTIRRPRLSIFKSNYNIHLQLIDDDNGHTLCSTSTLSKEFKEKNLKSSKNKEAAKVLAEIFAQKLKEKNISEIVFDRSGYKYHGRVKIIADALRQAGITL